MNKSSYVIIAVIVITMTILFSVQLSPLQHVYCRPYYGFSCEMEAFETCYGGEVMGHWLRWSYCDGPYTCVGMYTVNCYVGDESCRLGFICDDRSNTDCIARSN